MKVGALKQLSGLIELGQQPDADRLRRDCEQLRSAGFVDAYLGDLFLEWAPEAVPERLVFVEDEGALMLRPLEIADWVRSILAEFDLTCESAHYNQVLPPPGEPFTDTYWTYHDRMLDFAGAMGLKRVTTHPGWMFGSAMARYVGADATRDYRAQRLSQTALNRLAYDAYGGDDRVWQACLRVYQYLCERAARYEITVTLETAISEWYDLTLHPARMISFCQEVGRPNLGICVDSGHCHLNGLSVPDVIRACGAWMRETHFHDNYGTRDEHNPVGQGTIDWHSVIQALRDISYTGVITFEQRAHRLNGTRWRAWVDA